MKNKKHAFLSNGLFVMCLLAAGGCATTQHTAHWSGANHPAADSDQPLTSVDPVGPVVEPGVADDGLDEEETPELWTRFNAQLYAPDPEHITDAIETEISSVTSAEGMSEQNGAGRASAHEQNGPDLWDRIRAGFAFPQYDNPRIRAELDWFVNHADYLDRTVERARPYLYLIVDSLEQRKMPREIALLPIVESAFQPFAYSQGRAAGIWQFIPATGRHFGLKQNWWYDGRRDILASTEAALNYLQALHDELDDDWLLALAAYNSGAGTVKKAMEANRRRGKPTDFWSLQLPKETRAYVPKLLALAELFAQPDRYYLDIDSIPDEPVVTTVSTGAQIDLAKAAELAEISVEEIYRLNPAFNRWATDPEGPHELLLPIEKASLLESGLATIDESERITWNRYLVRKGDTLGVIAQRHHTTTEVLRKINNINGHMIHPGQGLLIPAAAKNLSSYTLSLEQRTHSAVNTPRQGNKRIYTVRSGDTLWDIAQKYRVDVNDLARWNAMSARDPLSIGQQLIIWENARTTTAAAGDTLEGATPVSNPMRRINYVVRRGDSLARISERFNVKVSQLRNWNSLPRNEHIQPGQNLTLYVDITAQTENI